MLSNDKIQRDLILDWVFNGCKYFHTIIEGESERFVCDKNLTLGFTHDRMYKYCMHECTQRVKQSNWMI